MILFKALMVGVFVGGLFTVLKLPLPAPTAWVGVAGIAGILIGHIIFK